MTNGWNSFTEQPITAKDTPVIVWHVYSGVMVEKCSEALSNQFMTHWQEIDDDAWIDVQDRKPTKADADAYDCVISQNRWGEITMAGWHRFAREASLVRWQHPPEPPTEFRELRYQAR